MALEDNIRDGKVMIGIAIDTVLTVIGNIVGAPLMIIASWIGLWTMFAVYVEGFGFGLAGVMIMFVIGYIYTYIKGG